MKYKTAHMIQTLRYEGLCRVYAGGSRSSSSSERIGIDATALFLLAAAASDLRPHHLTTAYFVELRTLRPLLTPCGSADFTVAGMSAESVAIGRLAFKF